MFLTKDGITIEVFHPTDIKRYKRLGYVEAKVGYPNPEMIVNGEKVEAPTPAEKPAEPPKGKGKKVNDGA